MATMQSTAWLSYQSHNVIYVAFAKDKSNEKCHGASKAFNVAQIGMNHNHSDYFCGLLLERVSRGEFDGDIHEVGKGPKLKVLVLRSFSGKRCLLLLNAISPSVVDVSSSSLLAFAESFAVTGRLELIPEGVFIRSIGAAIIYAHFVESTSMLILVYYNGDLEIFNYNEKELKWAIFGKHALISRSSSSSSSLQDNEEQRLIHCAMFVPGVDVLLWIENNEVLKDCRINLRESHGLPPPSVDCIVTLLSIPHRLRNAQLTLELGSEESSCWICEIYDEDDKSENEHRKQGGQLQRRLWLYSGKSGELLDVISEGNYGGFGNNEHYHRDDNEKSREILSNEKQKEEALLASIEGCVDFLRDAGREHPETSASTTGIFSLKFAESALATDYTKYDGEKQVSASKDSNDEEDGASDWFWLGRLHLATLCPHKEDLQCDALSYQGLGGLEIVDLASLIRERVSSYRQGSNICESMELEALLVGAFFSVQSSPDRLAVTMPAKIVAAIQYALDIISLESEAIGANNKRFEGSFCGPLSVSAIGHVWNSLAYAGLHVLSSFSKTATSSHLDGQIVSLRHSFRKSLRVAVSKALFMSYRAEQAVQCLISWHEAAALNIFVERLRKSAAYLERTTAIRVESDGTISYAVNKVEKNGHCGSIESESESESKSESAPLRIPFTSSVVMFDAPFSSGSLSQTMGRGLLIDPQGSVDADSRDSLCEGIKDKHHDKMQNVSIHDCDYHLLDLLRRTRFLMALDGCKSSNACKIRNDECL